MTSLEDDVRCMHPLVHNGMDLTSLSSTSMVLARRCLTCDRPVAGVREGFTAPEDYSMLSSSSPGGRGGGKGGFSRAGALQGSILLSQTMPQSKATSMRISESRGGGFRVVGGHLAPGAGMLWVGGDGSPTGRGERMNSTTTTPRRPSTSVGFRERRQRY